MLNRSSSVALNKRHNSNIKVAKIQIKNREIFIMNKALATQDLLVSRAWLLTNQSPLCIWLLMHCFREELSPDRFQLY